MGELLNRDYLVSSDDYCSAMNDMILPELTEHQEIKSVSGKDGFPLFCSCFRADNSCGTVLILHGFTENTYKYSELIYSLLRNHFNVVAYDQRGHGRSGRAEGLSHFSVTHVDRFEDYVDDLAVICDTVLTGFPKPWMLFAHSMGGAVASLYLEQYHHTFSAAALCAPMIAPNTGGLPAPLASCIARILCCFGKSKSNPFFMKPYSGPEDFNTSCATDPARFFWYDKEKTRHREYQNNTPSCRWILESVAVTGKILASGAPESISCPVLLSTADRDSSVDPDAQKLFIDRIPGGKHIFVKDSRHEIFRSVNQVFFPWWHEVLSFFEEASA